MVPEATMRCFGHALDKIAAPGWSWASRAGELAKAHAITIASGMQRAFRESDTVTCSMSSGLRSLSRRREYAGVGADGTRKSL